MAMLKHIRQASEASSDGLRLATPDMRLFQHRRLIHGAKAHGCRRRRLINAGFRLQLYCYGSKNNTPGTMFYHFSLTKTESVMCILLFVGPTAKCFGMENPLCTNSLSGTPLTAALVFHEIPFQWFWMEGALEPKSTA